MLQKIYIYLFSLIILFLSCNNNIEEEVITAYPNGIPAKINSFIWKGDKKEIIKEVRFYPNGEKEIEGKFKDGKKHGKWIYWHENGNKWSEGYFKQGLSHGKFTIYYKSGKKNYIGFYKKGKPDGKWTFYNSDGKKIKEVYYKDGKKEREKDFSI